MSIFDQLKELQYWAHAGIITAVIVLPTYYFKLYNLNPIVMVASLFGLLVVGDVIAHWSMEKFFGWSD